MTKLRVNSFGVSVDGYGAGPGQGLDHPLGVGGEELHQWVVSTRMFRTRQGEPGGDTGPDDDFAARGFDGIGAWILGRNMFGPIRGPGPTTPGGAGGETSRRTTAPSTSSPATPGRRSTWRAGTTFHFVTGGIHDALEQATAAANGLDIRLGGGVNTIRQYLGARLLDELHIAIAPCSSAPANHCSPTSMSPASATRSPNTRRRPRPLTSSCRAATDADVAPGGIRASSTLPGLRTLPSTRRPPA